MSNASDGGNVGQTSIQARSTELHNFADHSMSREQAAEAVLIDLDTLTTLKGSERSAAVGTMGRIAERSLPFNVVRVFRSIDTASAACSRDME